MFPDEALQHTGVFMSGKVPETTRLYLAIKMEEES